MTLNEIKAKIAEDPNSIDWESLSQYRALDQNFIEEYADKLDWNCISQYQSLDPDSFILPHKDEVNWNKIYRYQRLDSDWIESLPEEVLANINFDTISETQSLSSTFLNKFQDLLNWNKISIYQNLSSDDLDLYYDKLDKKEISRYQDLSESFIDDHKDDLYWPYICKYQDLSESFINDHLSYIDWNTLNIDKFTSLLTDSFVISHKDDIGVRRILAERKLDISTLENLVNTIPTVVDAYNNEITRYQTLTETFIENHDKYVMGNHNNRYLNWSNISFYQGLSEGFMTVHKDDLYWPFISVNQICGQDFIRDNRNRVNWKSIIINQPNSIDEDFLMEFMDIELNRDAFNLISRFVPLKESTLIDNLNYIGWTNIARYQDLSPDFLDSYANMLCRPRTICIDRDILPIVPYGFVTQDYIDDLLIDFKTYEAIDYNYFVKWHYYLDHMKALNSFWDAYDHYMIEKVSADRLNEDYTHDIKKYRHFDWLMK